MTLIKQLELSDIISHDSMFNFVNVKLQVLSLPLSSPSVTHGVSHHYHNGTTALFFCIHTLLDCRSEVPLSHIVTSPSPSTSWSSCAFLWTSYRPAVILSMRVESLFLLSKKCLCLPQPLPLLETQAEKLFLLSISVSAYH